MVKALVDMCGKNDIKILAEGVETAAELEFLMDRVDYLQGFLFAKPSEEPQKRIEIRRT